MQVPEFFEDTSNKLTTAESVEACLEILCQNEYIKYATFQFVISKHQEFTIPFVKTTYPIEWVDYYLQNNLMDIDPVVRFSLCSDQPYFWSEIKLTDKENLMMQKSASFGLAPIGFSVPTSDVGPYRGLLSINHPAENHEIWEGIIVDGKIPIVLAAQNIHKFARNEIDPNEEYVHNLSKRELECLRLISKGKTHGDISQILGISSHTARGYFRTLRLKLNCATLAQAVASAKDTGLI